MTVKTKSKKTSSRQKKEFSFPLKKENFMIIGFGILLLLVGYILMAQNSVDGFMPTVIAPVLLVFGYCVVIPYGILKKEKTETAETKSENIIQDNVSNVKTS